MQKSTVVIVRHHEGDLDDIASVHLAARHFSIEHCYPYRQPDSEPAIRANNSLDDVCGTIIMGGAQNVTELADLPYLAREIDWIRSCIDADIPVIGICLGAQLVAHALGGSVGLHPDRLCEFGYEPVYPVDAEKNDWITRPMHMVQAHFQGFELPPGCVELATGSRFAHQAFRYGDKVFGFQFHPEVSEAMFIEWQSADWADEFYAARGSQPRIEASRYNRQHNPAQKEWFCSVLDRLFPGSGVAGSDR